jgi:hypothetical protein
MAARAGCLVPGAALAMFAGVRWVDGAVGGWAWCGWLAAVAFGAVTAVRAWRMAVVVDGDGLVADCLGHLIASLPQGVDDIRRPSASVLAPVHHRVQCIQQAPGRPMLLD